MDVGLKMKGTLNNSNKRKIIDNIIRNRIIKRNELIKRISVGGKEVQPA